MNEQTITAQDAFDTLSLLINKSVAEGSLILKSANCLGALLNTAKIGEATKAENEILKKRIEDLELQVKTLTENK